MQLEKKKKKRTIKLINNKSLLKIWDINYDSNNLVKLAHRGTTFDFINTLINLKYFYKSLIKSGKNV